MAVVEILVEIAELTQAANELNQASETYEEAVNAAKATAEELAANWEGEAKDAFVKHQENAYDFYKKMLNIVREMISVVRQAIQKYQEMADAVQSIVGG